VRPAADWSTAAPPASTDARTGAEGLGDRWRGVAGLVAWFAGLAAAIWLLQVAGRGVLAPPPLTSLDGIGRWLEERDGVTVGFAVLRLLAVGVAWYLVVSTVVGLAVRLSGAGRMLRLADTATVPAVRRLLTGAAGLGVTATSVALAAVPLPAGPLSAAPPASEPAPPEHPSPPAVMTRLPDGTATMRRLPAQEPSSTTTTAPPAPTATAPPTPAAPTTTAGPPTTVPPPPTSTTAPPAGSTSPTAQPAPPAATPTPPAHASPADEGDTWTIEPGDHLWAVAEETLADAWGRAPDDDEVLGYWTVLVAVNRDRLADPGNPDLVFPGQVMVLPPVPPPPG
jgi:hypothetical protein